MPQDFQVTYHGSIATLAPLTPEAEDWVQENLPTGILWFGNAIAIEPRYLDPILDGITRDGLHLREDA